jgi:hypothetical protein
VKRAEVKRASELIARLRRVQRKRRMLFPTKLWRPTVHERLCDEAEQIERQLRELFRH